MKKNSIFLAVLVCFGCTFFAANTFSQSRDKKLITEAVEAVVAAKSYQRMLSYTDVVNGTALNGAGKESRFTDDDIKNRRLFTQDLAMALAPEDTWLIVMEKNVATVRLHSLLVSSHPTQKVEGQGSRYQNHLTLVKRNNVWIVSEWVQIQLQEEPQKRPERKEWR